MSTLVWDQVGVRRYETGVDRGVLYSQLSRPVPWNGLISINEVTSREVKPYYIDGIKYLDHFVPGTYSAKLSAFTYPDVMDELVGAQEFAPGVFLQDQASPQLFNLSYRTKVGNDVEGVEYGYKLHILYNLLATLSDTTLTTVGSSVTPQSFEWTLSGTPPAVYGIRPTSHIYLDSRRMDVDTLAQVEGSLYGTSSSLPYLPTMLDLLDMVRSS